MVSIKDVAKAIKMLGDVVKSTREVIDAVKDGKKFLAMKYPEAQKDFSSLIGQMQLTIEGLATVTSVISGFRFVTDGKIHDSSIAYQDLSRFNDYIIQQDKDITALKNSISKLKTNCEKVKELRDKLDSRTKDRSWGSLFGLLGKSAQKRTIELHGTISNFYADDQRMIELFTQTLALAEQAIKDVGEVLGPSGTLNPYNIPEAAEMLGTYAVLFARPNKELHKLADTMSEVQASLSTKSN